ncbi:MAG: TonB-dependent receptor [Candidatus Eremiobacteraeota bacterium]|nr:TonB-dependent receptor [Candidatus Eremiobacteraeota bacterium]
MAAPVVATLALVLTATPGWAETPAHLTVTVVADDRRPAGGARVTISGPRSVSDVTPSSGVLDIEDLPAGVYRVSVALAGYVTTAPTDVELGAGERRVFAVRLDRPMTVIGRVQSRPQAEGAVLGADSSGRRISETLVDALQKLAGVSVARDAEGGPYQISIRNRESSQTAVSVGGVQLSETAAAALRSIGPDFAVGADVNYDADPGGLGGSVNFRTLEPTKSFRAYGTASYGSFEHAFSQVSVTGTRGRLGYALQHAVRGADSPLTGLLFGDQSGLDYVHDGAQVTRSDSVKLRWTGARSSVSYSYLVGNAQFSVVCARDLTAVPCGTGPDNWRYNRFGLQNLEWTRQIGSLTVRAGLSDIGGKNVYDDSARRLQGTPDPLAAVFSFWDRGAYLSVVAPSRRHTFSFTATGTHEQSAFEPTAGAYQVPQHVAQQRLRVRLDDRIRLNDRDTAGITFSGFEVGGAPPSSQVSMDVSRRTNASETITVSASVGRGSDPPRSLQPWTDPRAASVYANCNARSLAVGAPGDPALPFSYDTVTAQYHRTWRGGFVRVNGYAQYQRDDAISANFPITALAPSAVPTGYVDALAATWHLDAVCGATPFDPQRVYVAQRVAGTRRVYRGIDATVQVTRKDLILIGTLSRNAAVLHSDDLRLAAPTSYFLSGAQLPGRPLWRGGLTADYFLHRAGIELLANVQYTGGNNAQYLPPYTVLTLGASRTLRYGKLTLFEGNVFNVFANRFATADLGRPLPLANGSVLLPNAAQLAPRQITVMLSVQTGGR